MAKKQLSFAEKAKSKKAGKDFTYVKLIRSVKTKSGDSWRFNEQILGIGKGENIDSALKRLDERKKLTDAVMPQIKSENASEETVDKEVADQSANNGEQEKEESAADVKAETDAEPEAKSEGLQETEPSKEIKAEK